MTTPSQQLGRLRVRLWFGPHQIADYVGEAALAHRYAASIRRRFGGLTATIENVAETSNEPLTGSAPPAHATVVSTKPVPSELLWGLTPT